MNYEEMSDLTIDRKVFVQMYGECISDKDMDRVWQQGKFRPCSNPSDAWPIIFENSISMLADSNYELERNLQKFKLKFTGRYIASAFPVMSDGFNNGEVQVVDKNPLRAAMICFLKIKDAENGNN